MSVSCVGTCSSCGTKRFWLSDTLSLQLDDGSLKCLPHPAEGGACEAEGLTLAQASGRGRLYRETFFVCRSCGKDGETIERQTIREGPSVACTVRDAAKWGWGSAAIVVTILLWTRWWQGAASIGGALVIWPGLVWWENRKAEKASAARGLPRADAPGSSPIPEPSAGCSPETIVGQPLPPQAGKLRATGPCCERADWIEAFRVRDEDRVPCAGCGGGPMVVSERAIH